MTRLTFYGGVNEVGGNKILLEDRDVKVFLDFGMSFVRRRQFWADPYLSPRKERDLIELGLLPDLLGVYKFDESVANVDGVFITHSHMDHAGYISMFKPQIPVWCSHATLTILEALSKVRMRSFETDITQTKLQSMGRKVTIDNLEVEAVPVDHSVPGSVAYLIYTPAGNCIAYTGDYRMTRSPVMRDFIALLKQLKPDVLITEATNLVGAHLSTEYEIRYKLERIVRSCDELVLANFAYADVERFKTFYEVAKATGRQLGISTRQAFLLNELSKVLELPDLRDPNLVVYVKKRKKVLSWEKQVIDTFPNLKTSSEIKAMQKDFILTMTFWDLAELVDIVPKPGSCYIFSMSEPMNEEQELEFVKLVNWLDHYGLPQYHVHVSGHVLPHELRWLIQQVKPRITIPVHTEHPLLFKRLLRTLPTTVLIPRYGQSIEVL